MFFPKRRLQCYFPHRSVRGALLLALSVGGMIIDSPQALGQGREIDKAREQLEQSALAAGAGTTPGSVTDDGAPSADEMDYGDETEIDIAISSVLLIPHQDELSVSPMIAPNVDRIHISPDLQPPDGLRQIVAPFLDKKISIARLNRMAHQIIKAYQAGDYPLVDVFLPEQNISQGKIQLVVREAVLGEMRVEGARYTRPEHILKQFHTIQGERINQTEIEADLSWINDSPVRRVDLVYDRGAEDGTSDIILKTTEIKPLSFYASLANTGIELTGEDEWAFGFTHLNLFGIDHRAGYNYGADFDFETLDAHTLFYRLPLPWRDHLTLIGSYVDSGVFDTLSGIDIDGESGQVSIEYDVNLPTIGNFRQGTQLAVDYKSTNTDLLVGGTSLFSSTAEIAQLRLEYNATLFDRAGYTRAAISGIYSPGNLFGDNTDASFDEQRAGATSDYFYARFEIERLVKLPRDFTFEVEALGQYTDDRLISTEELLAGGHLTVRGFDENLIRSDSGAILRASLSTPMIPLLADAKAGHAQFFGFYDGAFLHTSDPVGNETDPSIQGMGVGFRYRFGNRGLARLAYGWNIAESGLPDGLTDDGRLHFGVTLNF